MGPDGGKTIGSGSILRALIPVGEVGWDQNDKREQVVSKKVDL